MNKIKIKFYSKNDIEKFINIANTFVSSINVFDRNMCVDGKSVLGMYAIGFPKEIEVQIISDSAEEERRFNVKMEEFRKFDN